MSTGNLTPSGNCTLCGAQLYAGVTHLCGATLIQQPPPLPDPTDNKEHAYLPSEAEYAQAERAGDKRVLLQHTWASLSHRQLVATLHLWHDRFYLEENAYVKAKAECERLERELVERKRFDTTHRCRHHGTVLNVAGDCPTCAEINSLKESRKLAPVQGFSAGIPWSLHLRAYDAYCKRYGSQQALIEGGCRGGFGVEELDKFVPGWREEVSDLAKLKARVTQLEQHLSNIELEASTSRRKVGQ